MVLTAPLAIIKINGQAVGKMRNLTINENVQRAEVRGIGSLTPSEIPAISWSGTLSCDMYNIDFSKGLNVLTNGKALQRVVQTVDEFVDTVLLQEDGMQIDIMRKVTDSSNAVNGVKKSKLEVFASVKGCFLTREGMNLAENQISGRNSEFMYTTPIINPL